MRHTPTATPPEAPSLQWAELDRMQLVCAEGRSWMVRDVTLRGRRHDDGRWSTLEVEATVPAAVWHQICESELFGTPCPRQPKGDVVAVFDLDLSRCERAHALHDIHAVAFRLGFGPPSEPLRRADVYRVTSAAPLT